MTREFVFSSEVMRTPESNAAVAEPAVVLESELLLLLPPGPRGPRREELPSVLLRLFRRLEERLLELLDEEEESERFERTCETSSALACSR